MASSVASVTFQRPGLNRDEVYKHKDPSTTDVNAFELPITHKIILIRLVWCEQQCEWELSERADVIVPL
jgi:hypothetical protein